MTDIDAIRKLSPSDQETLDTLCDIEAYFRKEYAYEVENAGSGGSTIAAGMWKRYFMALYNLSHDLPELIAYGPRLTALQVAFDAKCEELAALALKVEDRDNAICAMRGTRNEMQRVLMAAEAERDAAVSLLRECRPIVFADHIREVGTRVLARYTLTARIDAQLAALAPPTEQTTEQTKVAP